MENKESIKRYVVKDVHGHILDQNAFSVVGDVHVTVEPGHGEPSADVEYVGGELYLTLHNIEGNGITDIVTDSQEGDEAINTVTIKTEDNPEGVVLEVRNGSKGNGIESFVEVGTHSDTDGATNTYRATMTNGSAINIVVKNGETGGPGPRGFQGDSAVYSPDPSQTPVFEIANTTGLSTTKSMSQKAVTEMNQQRLTKWTHFPDAKTGRILTSGGVRTYENRTGYTFIQFRLNNLPGKTVKVVNNSGTNTVVAFTSNAYVKDAEVTFPYGEVPKVLAANSELLLDVPDGGDDPVYFFINNKYNSNDIDFDFYMVDTVREVVENNSDTEMLRMQTSLANGVPYKLDKDNLHICPIYTTSTFYTAEQASIGKKPEQVEARTPYDLRNYLVPVDNVAYIKMYAYGGVSDLGNLFLDDEYNIVHFCGTHNRGIGYALVPPTAKYLLYTSFRESDAELTLYPKVKREFAEAKTFTLGEGDWQKMLYYRLGSSQQVGDSFFSDSSIVIADESITSGGETTTIDMYLIDISGYDYIDMLSFRNSSGVGHDILDENGIVLKHISRPSAWGEGAVVPTVDIPAGGKWLVYHCYANKYATQRGVTLRTKGAGKKTVRILYIGNSLTQDGVAYLPKLLGELAPEIDYRFYVWYHGGWTLAQHYSDFINNRTAGIFSISNDSGGKWLNLEDSVTMAQVLSQYEFDVLCVQEYMNTQTTISTEAFQNVVSYVREHYNKPFKVATLLHPPKRSDIDEVYERTVNEVRAILSGTEAETVIDTGASIMEAMSTSLDELGDEGHLSPDGTHTQEGLPCLLQTYVHALWLFRLLGLPYGVANSKLRITQEVYDSINVPGPNLGTGVITGTDAQHAIAQLCAIKADKAARKLESE